MPEYNRGDGQIRIDLHIHSQYSHHGPLEPEEVVRIARKSGLDDIATTDHNTIRGALLSERPTPLEIGGF